MSREQILESPRWRQVQQEFDKWLSLQVVNTPQQVQQLKAQLNAEIKKMSPEELEKLLNQWDAKLKVLLSPDAAEAREWLGQYLSVLATGRHKSFYRD